MKKLLVIIVGLTMSFAGFSQSNKQYHIPLIGEEAPSFEAKSTMGSINFPDDFYAKWKIILSHPADFTSVCSTEIMELARIQDFFDDLNTQIIVLSTDGLNSHIGWVKSLQSIEIDSEKIPTIKFPLVSDTDLSISRKYGMLNNNSSNPKNIRAVFIIDPDNKVQSIIYYPSQIGRNLKEIQRVLIALQTADNENILTPVNWMPGEDYMISSPSTVDEAKKLEQKGSDDLYSRSWYMWFKKNKSKKS